MGGCFGKGKGGRVLITCAKCGGSRRYSLKNFPLMVTVDRDVNIGSEEKPEIKKKRFTLGHICKNCAIKDARQRKGLTVKGKERKA